MNKRGREYEQEPLPPRNKPYENPKNQEEVAENKAAYDAYYDRYMRVPKKTAAELRLEKLDQRIKNIDDLNKMNKSNIEELTNMSNHYGYHEDDLLDYVGKTLDSKSSIPESSLLSPHEYEDESGLSLPANLSPKEIPLEVDVFVAQDHPSSASGSNAYQQETNPNQPVFSGDTRDQGEIISDQSFPFPLLYELFPHLKPDPSGNYPPNPS